MAEHKNYYGLLLPDGRQALGVIRKRLLQGSRMDLPVVGDWVQADLPAGEERLSIESVEPRQRLLSRREAGRSGREQPFAANVDLVLVVEALDRPLNPARLQRFCAVAQRSGAQVLTLLNKADSHPPSEEAWQALQHALPGMRLLAISARDGRGLQPVLDLLKPGVVAALLGPSGAGKSTLANRLAGADLQGVGLVRFGDGKGRHTTTSRRMIELPGGAWLIDSPGVREMGLVASGEGLDESFEDLRALAQGCRFRDCRHEQEPGCALRAAVEAGGLEAVRLGRFLALRLEGEIANRGRAGRQGRAKAPGSFKTLS